MSVNVRTVLSKVTSYLSFFSWKNVKAILSPSNTTGVIWQYFAGSLAWLAVVGMAAMNLRTYLTYPANSPQVGVTYYSFLTLHGWSAMLGLVPNAAIAVIAYSMYKDGLSIRRTRLMSALFWISNLGLLFALLGGPDMGWYMYPPLAIEDNSNFHAFLLYRGAMIGIAYLALALSSMAQTIATIVLVGDAYATKPRGQKLGIFAAYGVAFAVIIALTLPALTAAELWYSLYFLASVPVNTLLWLVLFWFYGHPVVYYVPFPLFGALYYYVPKFAGRELFSEKWARWNIYLLAIGSMLIWVHHLQTFPIPVLVRLWINLSTLILASGSGLTVLNLGLTVLLSKGYNFRDPVGMATLMALVGFILGGVQAVPLPMLPINPIVHNTYYVVGHFHLVIWTLILMGFTAVFLDLLRTVRPGFDYSKQTSMMINAGILLWTIPFATVGYLMSVEGYMGMLRRVIAYPTVFYPYNLAISLLAEVGIAGIVMAIGSALVEFLTYSTSRTVGVSVSGPSIGVMLGEGGQEVKGVEPKFNATLNASPSKGVKTGGELND
ncbi:heme/copper-type cytochrome/quinol oxidase, subunit 1 [Metallosphaera yellowstonensis MK1]|uniref:Heme/copper-type cytochrome/quinol oxidase, subunit 1 n=1 Tax=Metallosphaera yellowstonensis MK1 TaxID=671065 RepID=H2C5S9_9CREN|nr:proton pump complex quinol oxidase subunit SoxB [Metallosphaera yellowstonensis]EHP69156.1 heme/copper-type cytochrome/quinol oxidase, subunit 1 [Metallosphaera yellowstonensis MK1]